MSMEVNGSSMELELVQDTVGSVDLPASFILNLRKTVIACGKHLLRLQGKGVFHFLFKWCFRKIQFKPCLQIQFHWLWEYILWWENTIGSYWRPEEESWTQQCDAKWGWKDERRIGLEQTAVGLRWGCPASWWRQSFGTTLVCSRKRQFNMLALCGSNWEIPTPQRLYHKNICVSLLCTNTLVQSKQYRAFWGAKFSSHLLTQLSPSCSSSL